MNKVKKVSLYELNPRFFKDFSGNGVGDLKGLLDKVSYFDFLGVDGIIINDILSYTTEDSVQSFTLIAKEIGNIKDFKTFVSKAKKQGTNVLLSLKIGSIKETHKWFKNAETQDKKDFDGVIEFKAKKTEVVGDVKYNSGAKGYYSVDGKTQEVPLNWRNEKVMEQFIKVIKFWNEIGVTGFVFEDFEYIADDIKTKIMSEVTLIELRKFYRAIKEINDDIIVVGKSSLIKMKHSNDYTVGTTKVFDYFMSQQVSMLGTSTKFGVDEIGSFKPKRLVELIKSYVNNPSNILSFGSEKVGRVVSRWGNNGALSKESSKILGMLLMLHPGSSSIYYGDELGSLNIGLTRLDDFQDKDLQHRRRASELKGLSEEDFMLAQVLQAPINARSLMAWNDEKNGGFSKSIQTITPVSSTYKEINVENQFSDSTSSLQFYKELSKIIKTPAYEKIIRDGKFAISIGNFGIIKINWVLGEKEVTIFINLSDKIKKIKKLKEGRVRLSTHTHKIYEELPWQLSAFEGVIISKNINENDKDTQEIKLQRINEEKIRAAKIWDAKTKEEAKAKEVAKAQAKEEANARAIAQVDAKAKAIRLAALADEERKKANIDKEIKIVAEKERKMREDIKKKQDEKTELEIAKEQAKIAKEAMAKLKQKNNNVSIMDEEIFESDWTTLKEEDIASTTQIDPADIDDFDAFLNESKK